MTNAIAYYRVSTKQQGQSGLGLEAQKMCVAAYVKANGLTLVSEYTEVETGTKKRNRPQIAKAIAESKATGAMLIIAKLDRLARNVHFISGLMETGVKFVACDMPQVTNLTLHILAAVAEEEAKMISQRTKAGLEVKKLQLAEIGEKLGTPENLTHEAQKEGATVQREAAKEAMKQAYAMIKLLHNSGRSLAQIATALNEAGFTTRQGKAFQPMTVKRILDRGNND